MDEIDTSHDALPPSASDGVLHDALTPDAARALKARRLPLPELLDLPVEAADGTILAQLEQAWWRLARPEGLPLRRDVNAMTMGAALPYAFIAERIAPGLARFRVAGRRISEQMGVEARGMPLSSLFNAGSRKLFQKRLEMVFATPALMDLPLISPRGPGRRAIHGRLLILPLASDTGAVDRAMGALLMDTARSGTPRRLDLLPEAEWRCDTFRSTQTAAPQQATPMAHPAASFLRLVVDNG